MDDTKPADTSKLAALHRKFAAYLENILDEATTGVVQEDGTVFRMPLDAATMGCISKFLKDNDITAEPAEKANLEALREKFSRKRTGNSQAAQNIRQVLDDANEALMQ